MNMNMKQYAVRMAVVVLDPVIYMHRQNFFFNITGKGSLLFLYELWFKFSVTISGYLGTHHFSSSIFMEKFTYSFLIVSDKSCDILMVLPLLTTLTSPFFV